MPRHLVEPEDAEHVHLAAWRHGHAARGRAVAVDVAAGVPRAGGRQLAVVEVRGAQRVVPRERRELVLEERALVLRAEHAPRRPDQLNAGGDLVGRVVQRHRELYGVVEREGGAPGLVARLLDHAVLEVDVRELRQTIRQAQVQVVALRRHGEVRGEAAVDRGHVRGRVGTDADDARHLVLHACPGRGVQRPRVVAGVLVRRERVVGVVQRLAGVVGEELQLAELVVLQRVRLVVVADVGGAEVEGRGLRFLADADLAGQAALEVLVALVTELVARGRGRPEAEFVGLLKRRFLGRRRRLLLLGSRHGGGGEQQERGRDNEASAHLSVSLA